MRWLPVLLALLAACEPPPDTWTPSDDPDDYAVDHGRTYRPVPGQPRWVVPSAALPDGVAPLAANNNVDIVYFGGRLFMAWRSAETHFASPNAAMYIVSSADHGASWKLEHTVAPGTDVREPRFLSIQGGRRLLFHWFEAGQLPTTFEPKQIWRIERRGCGDWSEPEALGDPGEVAWTIKGPRRGRYYMTSYVGEHYSGQPGELELRLRVSDDGLTWRAADPTRLVVYRGGVSEAAVELDEAGVLWAVTRNEDGDASGFGSHLCQAPAGYPAHWTCPATSDPERYDSPWIFRHAGELYLVARRDPGGPYDQGEAGLTLAEQRTRYLLQYSLRPKRTALYRIDRLARKVRHIVDLPSAGDTAFPSVRRTGPHTFLVANYSSPLDKAGASWLSGQTAVEGTGIYLLELTFEPES